jgi:hypothetical protein
MRVDLGSMILEQSTNPLEGFLHCKRIPGAYGLGGSQKRPPRLSPVLMENKHRKNVPKQHASRD